MTPNEAMQYLAQLAGDYVRTLPPSAALPTQQLAQEAINTLVPLVQLNEAPPPDPSEKKGPQLVRPASDQGT